MHIYKRVFCIWSSKDLFFGALGGQIDITVGFRRHQNPHFHIKFIDFGHRAIWGKTFLHLQGRTTSTCNLSGLKIWKNAKKMLTVNFAIWRLPFTASDDSHRSGTTGGHHATTISHRYLRRHHLSMPPTAPPPIVISATRATTHTMPPTASFTMHPVVATMLPLCHLHSATAPPKVALLLKGF